METLVLIAAAALPLATARSFSSIGQQGRRSARNRGRDRPLPRLNGVSRPLRTCHAGEYSRMAPRFEVSASVYHRHRQSAPRGIQNAAILSEWIGARRLESTGKESAAGNPEPATAHPSSGDLAGARITRHRGSMRRHRRREQTFAPRNGDIHPPRSGKNANPHPGRTGACREHGEDAHRPHLRETRHRQSSGDDEPRLRHHQRRRRRGTPPAPT